MPSRADNLLAVALALLLHVLGLWLVWLGRDWEREEDLQAAGPVIAASLQFSDADVKAAQAAIAQAKATPVRAPDPPRPVTPPPELQPKPQAPLERPDDVDQEAIVKVAPETSDETEEQRARQRQAQVDLTEDIERQRQAEAREKLREQLEAIRQEREQARERTRMEEQRLAQLADRRPATPQPGPARTPTPPAGNGGTDAGLLARYLAAINATAQGNWNHDLAPELVACKVQFRQYVGGDVYDVQFIDCPYDAIGRDSIDRALRKTPMPYAGFESVFRKEVGITFCYPIEACTR